MQRRSMVLGCCILLLTGAALLVNHGLRRAMLERADLAQASALTTQLFLRVPELTELLRGTPVRPAQQEALALAPAGSEATAFRLLGPDGAVLFGQPRALTGRPVRRPIHDLRGVAGFLEAELAAAPREALAQDAFALSQALILLFGGGALVLLRLQGGRGRREDLAEARARYLMRHDILTGLVTHAALHERLEAALAVSRRQHWHVGVLVLDLRRFREVNNSHGRGAGDLVLAQLADRLRQIVRREDAVARLSADRFAVVQAMLAEADGAIEVAERIRAALAEPIELPSGQVLRLVADIGIATAPQDGQEAEALLARAELALSAARAQPEPGIRCFEPALDEAIRRRQTTERDLRLAVAEGTLLLHYQPQFRLRDRRLIGFEALLRWPHPTRGLVPPDEFIPVAEQSGLIVPLGAWVIRTACAEAVRWPEDVRIAVNLSPAQFRHGDLVATVAQALASTGLPAHRLELEITESLLQEDTDDVVRLLNSLRDLGCSIAMDDFGTGWSSLAHLWRFPFGKLKIDRAFVRDLGRDPKLSAIIATVVGLGRTLGMTVVAEGVETEEQARALVDEHCEQAQGWLFGRPLPAEAARALIETEVQAARRRAHAA